MGLIGKAVTLFAKGRVVFSLFRTRNPEVDEINKMDIFAGISDLVTNAAQYGEAYDATTVDRRALAGLGVAALLRRVAKLKGHKERGDSDLDLKADALAGLVYDIHECFDCDDDKISKE